MRLWRTLGLILANALIGNAILLLTVSSNPFLSFLLLHFKLIFHSIFTFFIVIGVLLLSLLMNRRRSGASRVIWSLVSTVLPVLVACWITIGYAFMGGDDEPKRFFFTLQFGSLISLGAGAVYWLPFWWINFFALRRSAKNAPSDDATT